MPDTPSSVGLRVRLERAEPLSDAAIALQWRSPEVAGADWELDLADWFRLMQRAAREGADETCRMSARPLALGATDFMVETMKSSRTLEDAMRRVATGYNLMHGGAYNRVERRPGRLVYVIDDHAFPYAAGMRAGAAHTLIEGVQIFLHAMLSLGVGPALDRAVARVTTRRRGGGPEGALGFWRAPVRRGAAVYTLEYDAALADVPIRALDAICGDDVYDAAVALVAARAEAPARAAFLDRCVDAVAAGVRDQPAVARRLGVSVATLRRRLDAAGVTFRELKARAQGESARSLLAGGAALGDVAERLGFSDARSFSRAFKARFGITPAAFAAGRCVSEFVLRD